MQRWEYCMLGYNSITYYHPTGDVTTQFDHKDQPSQMAELGREGWELVSVETNTDPERSFSITTFYFKRPLP